MCVCVPMFVCLAHYICDYFWENQSYCLITGIKNDCLKYIECCSLPMVESPGTKFSHIISALIQYVQNHLPYK